MSKAGLARSGPTLATDYEQPDEISPEQRLWRAIVANAFKDLTAPVSNTGRDREFLTRRARVWLTRDTPGLRAVCDLAELDCETVMDKAREMTSSMHKTVSEEMNSAEMVSQERVREELISAESRISSVYI